MEKKPIIIVNNSQYLFGFQIHILFKLSRLQENISWVLGKNKQIDSNIINNANSGVPSNNPSVNVGLKPKDKNHFSRILFSESSNHFNGNEVPLIPSIPLMIILAVCNELDLKKTQAKTIATNVIKREKKLYTLKGNAIAEPIRPEIFCHAWFIIKKIPCRHPQITNVQFAPCQRPPNSMVIIKLV